MRGRIILTAIVLIGFVAALSALDFNPAAAQPAPHSKIERGMIRQAAIESIPLSALPPEGRATFDLIKKGPPYPYKKDGTTFGNRERRLPQKPHGYYKEFTVKTPDARDRGARRVVAGSRGECYYSDDHYRTFKLIRE